jgi:hypothetical protein
VILLRRKFQYFGSAYLVGMGSVLMFGTIGSVTEGFTTAWKFTSVRLLSCVRSKMGLEVFQPRISFSTIFELQGNKKYVKCQPIRRRLWHFLLTVHLCGFSPVWRLMCTTNIYWALKGFSSLEQSFHWHTNAFLLLPIWSLLRCCKIKWVIKSIQQKEL